MDGDSREARQNMDQSVIKELVDGFVHEVKNPLTGIRVALKALGKKTTPEEPNSKVIEQISDQIGNINKALSDLMDFTRISTPKTSLTNIKEVLELSLDRIQSECQRHEIKVEKHLSGSLPEVTIDTRRGRKAHGTKLKGFRGPSPVGVRRHGCPGS
jgi:nitrogen-specific signal transduction histidine kinase